MKIELNQEEIHDLHMALSEVLESFKKDKKHQEVHKKYGCDVCDRTIQSKIRGQNEILSLIKRYNRRLTIREAALTLAGSRYTDVFEKKLFTLRGYGTLSEWSIDDIKDAIHQLVAENIIK